jgi:hypothetical protein
VPAAVSVGVWVVRWLPRPAAAAVFIGFWLAYGLQGFSLCAHGGVPALLGVASAWAWLVLSECMLVWADGVLSCVLAGQAFGASPCSFPGRVFWLSLGSLGLLCQPLVTHSCKGHTHPQQRSFTICDALNGPAWRVFL